MCMQVLFFKVLVSRFTTQINLYNLYPKIDRKKEEKARFMKLDESIDDQYIMHMVVFVIVFIWLVELKESF